MPHIFCWLNRHMVRATPMLACCFASLVAFGDDTTRVAILTEKHASMRQVVLTSYMDYWADTTGTATYQEAKAQRFQPFSGSDSRFDWRYPYWFRWRIQNQHSHTMHFILLVGYHNYSSLYITRNGDTVRQRAGNYRPLADRDYQNVWGSTYVNGFEVELPAYSETTFYLHTQNPFEVNIYGKNNFAFCILRAPGVLEEYTLEHHWISGLIQGALWFVLIFHVVQFLINRDPIYLWFCAFLASIILYLLDKQFIILEKWTYDFPQVNFYIFLIGSGMSFLSFLQFTRIIVQHVADMPSVDKLLKGMMAVLALFFISWLSIHSLNLWAGGSATWQPWLGLFPDWYRFVGLALFVGLIALNIQLWRKSKSKVARYYVAANSYIVLMMVFFFAYAFLMRMNVPIVQAFYRFIPVNYLSELGITGQVLLFSITLGYLWQEKEQQMRQEFTKQVAEVEMTALRSQMNPHFLFNCLNSINRFVVKNEPRKASDYLTKFSRLIRLILQNSKSQTIPLGDELEALRLYIEMESLRFEQRFDYEIRIGDEVEASYLEVPPMILQPYVENAIWHGLLQKTDGQGKLSIAVNLKDDVLICVIEDNGIGRQQAAMLKSKSATKKKSFGLQLTSERLKVLEVIHHIKTQVDIQDLTHPNGQIAGTRVKLCIPIF